VTAMDHGDRASATLSVVVLDRSAIVLGAFQRARSALSPSALGSGTPVLRRRSGGPAIVIAPGTLHVALALSHPSVLVPCDASRLVNRHVRPLLRALTKLGAQAQYFGRDFVSVASRPVAWVGFAHRAATGESLFEAFVGTTATFALPAGWDGYPPRRAPQWRGKEPRSLVDAAARPVSPSEVAKRLEDAYAEAYGAPLERVGGSPLEPADGNAAPWSALEEDAIGFVGARSGSDAGFGGDLLASSEIVDALSDIARDPPPEPELERAVAEALSIEGAVVEGVADRGAIVRVLVGAARFLTERD
jgi:hypothetical protein